jgi:hypothetical protein
MTKVGWDKYGDWYTALDRDVDERRGKPAPGHCPICDRRLPCRFHPAKS